MKTFKELLIELMACTEAQEWAKDKTVEQVVKECHRGDWLLWLAAKIDIGLQPFTLAKAHCANTVRHLMKDKRSIKAIDKSIAFGEGKSTQDDLNTAYASADSAASDAYDVSATASDAAYASAYATTAAASAYASACAAAAAASAASAAAYAATDYAVYAKKENQLQTANICRKYIGDLIIDKVNELLNTKR